MLEVEASQQGLRVAVVGCGVVGRRRAEVARQAGDDVRIVVDVDEVRARELASHVGGLHATRLEDALRLTEVDAVVVATPHSVLAEMATAALEQGKHVLCEKPLASNASLAQEVILSAQAAARILKVGFNHRYHRAIAKAHALVTSGAIGRPLAIRVAYGHGGRLGYEREWRGNARLAGGGELLDQGIHAIDLARWFLGELHVISGVTRTWFWPITPLEDNAFAILGTDDGRIASIHVSWTQWRNLFRFEVLTDQGAATVEGLGGSYGPETLTIFDRHEVGRAPRVTTETFDGPDVSWLEEWRDFASAIRSGHSPLGDGGDGLAALRIIDDLYLAANSRPPTGHYRT